MRIIARRTLREFVRVRSGHKDQPALKAALGAWFDEVRKARWSSTADVKRRYATASVGVGGSDRLQHQPYFLIRAWVAERPLSYPALSFEPSDQLILSFQKILERRVKLHVHILEGKKMTSVWILSTYSFTVLPPTYSISC